MPVFTVEDAIKQIKHAEAGYNKSEIEYTMDEWFVNNLPVELALADCIEKGGGSDDGDKMVGQIKHKRSGSVDLNYMGDSMFNDPKFLLSKQQASLIYKKTESTLSMPALKGSEYKNFVRGNT